MQTYKAHRNILVEEYKAIYYFLPKCGCTSLKAHLASVLNMDNVENFPKDIHNSNIYPFPFVQNDKLDSSYQDYFKFTIVRNPWSRLVSCYKSKIRAADYSGPGVINGVAKPLLICSDKFFGGMSFEAFVDVVCSISDADADNHFRSQLYQLVGPDGNLMVDYIGKLEMLGMSLNEITQASGIPLDEVPHLHKISSKPYTAFYNHELKEKVRERFVDDITFFDYKFDADMQPKAIGMLSEEKLKQYVSSYQSKMIDKKIKRKTSGKNHSTISRLTSFLRRFK